MSKSTPVEPLGNCLGLQVQTWISSEIGWRVSGKKTVLGGKTVGNKCTTLSIWGKNSVHSPDYIPRVVPLCKQWCSQMESYVYLPLSLIHLLPHPRIFRSWIPVQPRRLSPGADRRKERFGVNSRVWWSCHHIWQPHLPPEHGGWGVVRNIRLPFL
jgi:hypothetical protein